MRRFAAILFLLGFLFFGGKPARAQYYSWGADAAALRWKHLRTEDVRVVFPDTASALAHRTLYYIQAVRPTITHGFSHPPLKIPFVLHTENFQSNGLVMWMPKRIEFLTTPSVDSYSMPWVKQLVAHEYRHAVQYNNLNRGLIRILSYLIGQQGSTVGLLFMPLWALEGDAVMNETEMSSYGRGRQPRFTIEYRALGYEVLRRRNCDKWFCGSFRDFVPDHYQMGYQMVAYGYDRYGDGIWDKTLRYGVRNAYMLTFSTSVALRKFYGTGEGILFRDAFADLNRFWDSLPKVTDSGRTLTSLPEKNYTTYTHPVSLNERSPLYVPLKRTSAALRGSLRSIPERDARGGARGQDSSRAAPQPTDNRSGGPNTAVRYSSPSGSIPGSSSSPPGKNAPAPHRNCAMSSTRPRSGEAAPWPGWNIRPTDTTRSSPKIRCGSAPPGPCRASPKCTDWPGTMRPNGSTRSSPTIRACGSAGSNPARACRLSPEAPTSR